MRKILAASQVEQLGAAAPLDWWGACVWVRVFFSKGEGKEGIELKILFVSFQQERNEKKFEAINKMVYVVCVLELEKKRGRKERKDF